MKLKSILGRPEKANIERIQSDFVSLASHQLRTPLSAIKWYVEMLLNEKHGKLAKPQQEYLQEIYRSNERAINLVNDLLDVSRIQEGEINLQLQLVRVEDIIERVLQDLETLIRAGQIRINFEILSGPLPMVETDPEKLKRVIINILTNAIKYTRPGGKVQIVAERKSQQLMISIADTGLGMSVEDQAKVFKKFFRSPRVLKSVPAGTGLGLFIAKALVEAMNGKIGFTSQAGEGTKFYFTLPLRITK